MNIFFLLNLACASAFIKMPFGQPFKISVREINKNIDVPESCQTVVKKINGFYGLIGPDINMKTVNNVYDLFTGDGVIQGVFFDNGKITYTRHFVRTEKLLYEEQNGRIQNNYIIKILFGVLSKIRALPNLLGLANTVIFSVDENAYALYERDVPYQINIDFFNKTVNTIGRVNLPHIPHFSAHSKYNKERKTIETVDYDIFTQSISHFELAQNLTIMSSNLLPMNYLPIIHDFWSTDKSLIIFDSPLGIEATSVFSSPMPISLKETQRTFIHILDKNTYETTTYVIEKGVYMFHYANCKENNTHIDIYAPLYDKLDFSGLDINGKYRLVSINKMTQTVGIIKVPEFENLNIDFPILYGNRTVFRTLENKVNNGFIICEDLTIIKYIKFENRFICGEPAVQNINGCYYLFAYSFDTNDASTSFILIINLDTYEETEIPLNETMSLGFHSVFISSDSRNNE
jgi:carotenoid cleavage dioxygenase-like enzyme